MNIIITQRTDKERKAYYDGIRYALNNLNQKESMELMLLIESGNLNNSSKAEQV